MLWTWVMGVPISGWEGEVGGRTSFLSEVTYELSLNSMRGHDGGSESNCKGPVVAHLKV